MRSDGRGVAYLCVLIAAAWLVSTAPAFAQQPPAPVEDPGTWTGSAGAGLSLTSGNSDTLNFNLALDLTRDPKTRNVMKFKALYLRGEQDDATTVTGRRGRSAISTRCRRERLRSPRWSICATPSN